MKKYIVPLDEINKHEIEALACDKALPGIRAYRADFKTGDFLVLDRLKGCISVYSMSLENTWRAVLKQFHDQCENEGYSPERVREIKALVTLLPHNSFDKYQYNDFYYKKTLYIISEGRYGFIKIMNK